MKSPETLEALLTAGGGRERGMIVAKLTPLHIAARRAPPALIEALLAKGPDVNARNEGGWTPLHEVAARSNSPEVVVALLGAGADLEARNEGGWTPLHEAAANNKSPAVATALLDAGADVNARNEGGWTPLHEAAFTGFPAVVVALLDAGADPKALDKRRKMPWHYARKKRCPQGTRTCTGGSTRRASNERVLGFLPPWLSGCIGPLSEACWY